jgi:type I restriction enzyme S subunit
MNNIDALIAELCPDGVEFKELGDIIEKVKGANRNLPKSKIKIEGKTPVYTQGANQKPDGYTDELNLSIEEVPVILYGDHTNVLKWITHKFIIGADGVKIIKVKDDSILLDKFLFYCLKEGIVNIPNGYARHFAELRKMQIPLPPLPIQQKIVTILDKFTSLEAELEDELEARRAQYEFYRNELLNFEGKQVEWRTLGEVCDKTENIKWKDNQNTDFQYIDLSSVSRSNNKILESQTVNSTNAPSRAQQIVNNDDVIFGTTRPTLNRYSLITSNYHNQICSTGFCVLRANQKVILPKYLFFNLTTASFSSYVENNQEGAGYPSISNSVVKKYKIPIPPLAEQDCIVSILDKFDKLVNDISEGLPAEIQARRKQYEYYRGKLLDFKNKSNG